MSSDDRGPLVLTPDMMADHLRLVEVSDLTEWDRNPYQGDVGAAHTFMATFGQLQLPIVVDDEVLYGAELVAAEVMGEQFDGRVAVLDLTDLGWPKEKVIAAALGLHQVEARATTDREHLASLLTEIRQADEAWLIGAGWDGDDLDDMLAQFDGPPSLEALEREHGSFTDDDTEQFWPRIILQVDPEVFARWTETFAALPGGSDTDRLVALLDALAPAEPEEPLDGAA